MFVLGALVGLSAAPPASAEDAMTIARSQTPQTISGEGDKILLVEGPFGIAWQSAGRIGVRAAPDVPGQTQSGGPAVLSGPPKAAADGSGGMAKGSMKLSGQQRYRVSIQASGPWEVTVSW
jgi:uncharacterized lipoprotein